MTVTGRHARVYFVGSINEPVFWMPCTYHRFTGGRNRQLTVTPKLLRRVLRAG